MQKVLYGELAVVGFNGLYESPDREPRRLSKVSLYKRAVPNGVRPGSVRHLRGSQLSSNAVCSATPSVSYTLSRHETVVVDYIKDANVDMFQIGRSTNDHIDFVVSEPHPSHSLSHRNPSPRHQPLTSCFPPAVPLKRFIHGADKNKNEPSLPQSKPNRTHPESSVSRFACRIQVERDPPHTARIYAAGFDSSNRIVLGELAIKWKSEGLMDGLTTNGVMILHADPEGNSSMSLLSDYTVSAHDKERNSDLRSQWREVSICGCLYEMREKRCVPRRENKVCENNILLDKTLIDLCGVTLFWRSASGLKSTATADYLRSMVEALNGARFQCPVMYHTLRLSHSAFVQRLPSEPSINENSLGPSNTRSSTGAGHSEPYVYLNCGHVHGWHTWLADGDQPLSSEHSGTRTCSLCLQPSRFVSLRMGVEPAFYVDRAVATHCFNPCGHMASEKTARYWLSIPLPNTHNFEFQARCPFCFVAIESEPVRLRFSGDVDTDSIHSLNVNLAVDPCPLVEPGHAPDDQLVRAN